MKKLAAVIAITLISISTFGTPLIPEKINSILGQIQPDMPEKELEKIVQSYYPKSKATLSIWSGRTGYVQFKISERYSFSVSEYNAPNDFESRFVQKNMTIYVYDHEIQQRVNISLYNWDEEEK